MTTAVEEVHIGSLAAQEPGAFKIGPFGSSLKKSELVNSGIPVMGIENVLGDQFSKLCRRFITPEKFKALSDYEIQPGDVLVTTMGTIGRAAVAPPNLGRCIFDSHLFRMRVDQERVCPSYLCRAVNSALVGRQLKRMAHGAIMQGLNTSILQECIIPLPPLPEQRRIVALLDQGDRLRRTSRYALELSYTVLSAVFVDWFGNPGGGDTLWPMQEFGALGTLDRGRSQHRPRNASHLYGGPYPFIQTGDVANAQGYIRSHVQTYSEAGLHQSKLWPAGTLCITIAANIAKTAILTYPACFPDSVVGFSPGKHVTIEFVQTWLGFMQRNLERTAPEVAQKNINLETLRTLECPVPPLELQRRFSSMVHRHEQLRIAQRESLRQTDHLFESLLHRVFQMLP